MDFNISDTSIRGDNFRRIEKRLVKNKNELTCQMTRTLYDWWSSYTPDFPSRSDFDIIKVPTLASNIYLVEVLGPGKYLYRLCGETVGHLVGHAYRMVEISLDSPKIEDSTFAKYLDDLIANRAACSCSGDLAFFEKDFLSFESFDCPLADETGTITHFIGVMCELPK